MRTGGASLRPWAVGGLALAAATWTVGCGAVPTADALPALMVPALFVLAGLLAPLWDAADFTARSLLAVGTLHLLATACSATARLGGAGALWWHVASQLLFVAGFGALLVLAAGYPAGPPARAAVVAGALVCLLPVLADLSGPTPVLLTSAVGPATLGPIASLLPAWVAPGAVAVFGLPAAAVVVAMVRAVRGGRETRGRLLVPIIALGAFALLILVTAVLPDHLAAVGTALFLVSVPLVPAGLVLGARPLRHPVEPAPAVDPGVLTAVPEPVLAGLSPREHEVLAAMADGATNAAIARRLHMSTSAVEKHTTAIFAKLDLPPDATTHRRVAAVVAYLRASR